MSSLHQTSDKNVNLDSLHERGMKERRGEREGGAGRG